MKKNVSFFVALVFTACTGKVSTGSADFTNFVCIGDSFTQGIMDGGLCAYGQNNSFPAIIAHQVGIAKFSQPLVIGNGTGYTRLVSINNKLVPIQANDPTCSEAVKADPSWQTWGMNMHGNHYSNLGISALRLTNCVALNPKEKITNNIICGCQSIPSISPYMVGNPCGRFLDFGSYLAANPIQYIDFIKASKATFFTCWIGTNDVLAYAIQGGITDTLKTPLGPVLTNAITPPAIFARKYDSILTCFKQLGAKGVCVTIPDITSIPFFTTVPSCITVNGMSQSLYITTSAGIRQATPRDLILSSCYNRILSGQGLTASNPLPNDHVLDSSEVDSVEIAIKQYNESIRKLAASFGFPVCDMNQCFKTLSRSFSVDATFNRQFAESGEIGLDGIHPNARGYAQVANQLIQTINSAFNSKISPVDVTLYKGVIFP